MEYLTNLFTEYFKCGIAQCGDDTFVDNRTNVCEDPHINNVGRAPHRFESVVVPMIASVVAMPPVAPVATHVVASDVAPAVAPAGASDAAPVGCI